MIKVDRDDLLSAFDFATMGGAMENLAFVSTKTDKTYITSSDIDDVEEIPEDLETSPDYVSLPSKNELGLGRDLAFDFVVENLPDEWSTVRAFFVRAGAYARFKDLLAEHNMLDKWYRYEEARTAEALREWCAENGLKMSDAPDRTS
jgi:hypothetical protein